MHLLGDRDSGGPSSKPTFLKDPGLSVQDFSESSFLGSSPCFLLSDNMTSPHHVISLVLDARALLPSAFPGFSSLSEVHLRSLLSLTLFWKLTASQPVHMIKQLSLTQQVLILFQVS